MELRVSEKGGVSVYYLNRLPFTLYAGEWKAVFEVARVILRFIAKNHAQLSCRCDAETRLAFQETLQRGDLGADERVGALWCRRATTGAVSLYGLRRFPVTLYCDQWLKVLDNGREEIEAFIRENEHRLSIRGASVPRPRRPSRAKPLRVEIGPDNIIRPVVAQR